MDIVEVGEFLFHFTQAQIMVIYLVHLTVFIYIGLFNPLSARIYTVFGHSLFCLLYTSPSPRDKRQSRMPSSA